MSGHIDGLKDRQGNVVTGVAHDKAHEARIKATHEAYKMFTETGVLNTEALKAHVKNAMQDAIDKHRAEHPNDG